MHFLIVILCVIMLGDIMLGVIMLNVIVMNVVAPFLSMKLLIWPFFNLKYKLSHFTASQTCLNKLEY
jgi:hypothetical protein